MSEVLDDRILPPDTAIFTTEQSSEYSGAASALRRWVARSEAPYNVTLHVRVGYFDPSDVWHELPGQGLGADHNTMAPLSDTSAILVHAGELGLGWAIADGDRWTEEGNLDPRPLQAAHPRLRFRPSGGLWLLWTERRWVHVSYYRDGRWFRGDSLRCAHPEGQTFWSAWCDASRDTAERPVLVWGDLGVGYTYRDVGCIAFPTDSGWAPGEEIPGSDNMFLTPYVARDRNGDAWVAWRTRPPGIVRWTHTYVSATTSMPVVGGAGRHRTVSWTLSEPAPESWWAVLRARNEGLFEQVARVQAGPDVEMSWADVSPPGGVVRYKIRRESVDARYRWESGEAWWPPSSKRPLVLTRSGDAAGSELLELTGADAGPLDVRVYDVQGRLVLKQEARAGGEGRDTVRIDLSLAVDRLAAGIYFAAIRDAGGRVTNSVRLVLLK